MAIASRVLTEDDWDEWVAGNARGFRPHSPETEETRPALTQTSRIYHGPWSNEWPYSGIEVECSYSQSNAWY